MSQEGSQAAVTAVVEAARGMTWGQDADLEYAMDHLFQTARTAMATRAAELGLKIGDVAATLGVVLDTGKGRCVGQVGDCFVFMRSGGTVSVIAPAPKAEYANLTTFLTSQNWQADYRFTDLSDDDVDGWLMTTDGLRLKILGSTDPPMPFEPFFEDTFAYCATEGATSDALSRFLTDLVDDQTGDDKTLVAAVRMAP